MNVKICHGYSNINLIAIVCKRIRHQLDLLIEIMIIKTNQIRYLSIKLYYFYFSNSIYVRILDKGLKNMILNLRKHIQPSSIKMINFLENEVILGDFLWSILLMCAKNISNN